MSVQSKTPASVVAFAPKKGHWDTTMLADDAGDRIVAMLHKAGGMAKEDCARAMNIAHKLSGRRSDEQASCT